MYLSLYSMVVHDRERARATLWMPLHHGPGDERAARQVRPPSKRARVNPRSRLGPTASRTNSNKEGASSGYTSTSSSKHASTLSPAHGLGEAGGQKPSASFADRIYDLSSELGVLRSRSVEALRSLRSTAQVRSLHKDR